MVLNSKISFLCLAMALLAISSCQKVVDLHLPEHQSKLVINAIVINDSLIKVDVSNSVGALTSNKIDTVNNAVITITNSLGQSEQLTYKGYGHYASTNLSGLAGASYNINASANGFESVSSQFSLPAIQTIDTAYFEITDASKQIAELVIKFTDNGSAINYYAVSIASMDSFGYVTPHYFEQPNQSINVGNNENYYGSDYYFTDEIENGKQIEKRLKFNYYTNFYYDSLGNPIANPLDAIKVLWFRSLSKEYYLYQKSYNTYLGAIGNPFAEPVQVYNNINGGFGIAAGYTQTVKLIQKR